MHSLLKKITDNYLNEGSENWYSHEDYWGVKHILSGVDKALEQMEEYKTKGEEESLPLYTTKAWDREKKELVKKTIGSKEQFYKNYNANKDAKKHLEERLKELEDEKKPAKVELKEPDKSKIQVGKKWTREDLKKWGIGE
jgi:hypothetical protein